MNKKFFMIVLCCSLAVLMCCCLSVYGALNLKCQSCGSTSVRTYTQSSANGHVATTVCNNCETVVLRGTVVAHSWNTSHICKTCGYKGSHSYSAKITKYPTCSSQGVRTYSCACGASFPEAIDVLDHKFSYQGGTKDTNNHLLKCQNCSATRYEKHTYNSSGVCSVCGYQKKSDTSTHTHNYQYYDMGTGLKHRVKCTECDKTELQDHNFVSVSNNIKQCKDCKIQDLGYEEDSSPCNHTRQYYQDSDKFHIVVCMQCKHLYRSEHVAGRSAKCMSPSTCEYCGKVLKAALGHDYVFDAKETTITEDTHTLICDNCEQILTEKHKMNGNICKVCGYVGTAQTCPHASWWPATCGQGKKCKYCGVVFSEPLGHVWKDATCTTPKTCTRCKTTEGKALGHNYIYDEKATKKSKNPDIHYFKCINCNGSKSEFHNMVDGKCTVCGYEKVVTPQTCSHNWKAATCDAPKTCTKCGATEGEALGHNWQAATCTKPKTCTRCKLTDGEALGHDFIYNGGTKTQNSHMLYCSRCSTRRAETHKMVNNECKICGYTCSHNYRYDKDVTKEKGDNKYHYVRCRKCNDIKAEEHTSGEKCSICGREREAIPECEPSKHNYKYTPTSDGSKHIAECTICGKTETQEHRVETDALNNNRCTACGLVYFDSTKGYTNGCNHPKKYSILYNSDGSIDATYHLMVCTDPIEPYVAEVPHEFDGSGRCTKCYVSKKCSKDYTAPGHPVYISQYKKLGENSSNSDKVHLVVKRCSVCNITFNYLEDHSYNINGVCICGYENVGAQKCTVDRTIEGHNPVLTGNSTIVNYREHRLYYYCNLCNRTFGKNEAHVYNEAGVCSCGARQDNFLCEHSSENYNLDGYDKSDDINKHIRKITCNICKAHAELREDHEFTDKKKCAKCEAEFVMKIKTNKTSLIPGEGIQLSITHNGDENVTFKYESSNTNLFEVDNNGIIKALENTNAKATKATITVKAYSGSGTELASEKFDMKYETKSKYTLTVDIPLQAYLGEETTLRAIASAELGNKDGIKWIINGSTVNQPKDSNSIKHIFSKLGKVQCRVTLSINNRTVTETRTVEVIERKTMLPAESMSILLDESRKILNVESLTIISGNSVIVSGNIVTAVELGTTILKDEKGNTYNINVTNKIIPVTDVKIDLGRNYDAIFVGEEVQANIIITPSNTTDEVTITSTNTNIASVTNAGLIIAKNRGKTIIKVVTSSGEFKKEIEVKQENLKLTTSTTIQLGVTEKNYKVKIDETRLSPKTLATLKCVGNNASVAIVSQNGVVSAQANGSITVKISVTLLNGKTKETTLKINVSDSTRATVGSTKYDKKEGINESSNKVYIYFGGSGAAKNGLNASDNKNIKGTTYQDTVIVPILKGNTDSWANWNDVVRDMEILLQSEEYADKEIVLVGYSSGGYPAAELALALAKKGRAKNVTLNVVDGVQGNGVNDCIARYDKLDEAGVNTTIYASNASKTISSRTRAVGEAFAEKEDSNIHYGGKLDLDHGQIQKYAQDLLTKQG